MAKKTQPTSKPVAETYIHVFTGKVQQVLVNVHINYAEGYISLVDHNPANPGATQGKQWRFQKRQIEYMAGWQDILDAMKSAIADATEKLKAYQEQEEKEKVELMVRVAEAE